MNSSLHTIRKQTLKFQFNGNIDGFALQKEVGDWCNFNLIPEIEQQLDLLELDENYFTIDKLEIEATASTNNWQQKIRDELIFSLKKKLRAIETKLSEKPGQKSSSRLRKLDELMLCFFEKGYLPWWEKALIPDMFEDVFRRWICEEMSPERAEFIRNSLKKTESNNQYKRIINLVPQELFFTFLRNIYNHEAVLIRHTESFLNELLENSISQPKENELVKTVNRLLLMMMVENNGNLTIDLIFRFLLNDARPLKGLEKFINPDFVDVKREVNPVKIAWRNYIATHKKEAKPTDKDKAFQTLPPSGVKPTGVIGCEPEKSSQDQPEDKTMRLSASEEEKILLYNKLIDRLTRPDVEDKSAEFESVALQEGIYIDNAGAVLFAAFLPALFRQLEIENNGLILKPELAALLVQYCVTGNSNVAEYELVLPKILCGIDIESPVNTNIQLTAEQMNEADRMLQALIEHWAALKNTSIHGLRESFLKRSGKLSIENNNWLIQVEQTSYDILMQHLPWGISMIKLPWMNKLLITEWV